MKKYILAGLILILGLTQAGYAAKEDSIPPMQGGAHFEIPAWFKNSFLDLAQDVEETSGQGKRLMIMFHQESCPYCAKLVNYNMAQQDIQDYLRKYFEIIDINIWGSREVTGLDGTVLTEKSFAAINRVYATPTLLFLDEKGQTVLRVSGYYNPARFMTALRYVAEKQETKISFRDYFARNHTPKSAAADSLHKDPLFAPPPHNLAGDIEGKPLAVFFEQKNCPACARLHEEVMTDKYVREQLKRYHVVQLDRWADSPLITPAGKRTTAKAWADQLNIAYVPNIVLFDKGKEAMRMDAMFKAFHTESILDYVASGEYQKEPELQRYLHGRSIRLRTEGRTVDLWK